MNQFLIGILLIVSFLCYYLWNENQVLTANNAALETAVATQEEAINNLDDYDIYDGSYESSCM